MTPRTLGALLVLAAGCGGSESAARAEPTPSFQAAVAVSPSAPLAGRRVSFNLEATNDSPASAVTDVELSVESAAGKQLYLQRWPAVAFRPKETWNLTHGFVTATDNTGVVTVRLVIRDAASQDTYFEAPRLAVFTVARGTADAGR